MTFRGIISSTRLKGETRGMTVASQERSGEDLLPLCFSVCMLAAGIYFRTSFASYSRRRTPSKLLSSKPPISGNIAIKLEEGSQRAPTTKPRPPRQTSYGATDRHSGFRTRGFLAVEDTSRTRMVTVPGSEAFQTCHLCCVTLYINPRRLCLLNGCIVQHAHCECCRV